MHRSSRTKKNKRNFCLLFTCTFTKQSLVFKEYIAKNSEILFSANSWGSGGNKYKNSYENYKKMMHPKRSFFRALGTF